MVDKKSSGASEIMTQMVLKLESSNFQTSDQEKQNLTGMKQPHMIPVSEGTVRRLIAHLKKEKQPAV
jgi:hypothetical protein